MPATHLSARARLTDGEQADRLEQVAPDHRQHHVQLEVAGRAPEGDRGVVADDLRHDLADRLGDDRVHLARHDRRTRLQVGQVDLGQAAARARRTSSAGRSRSCRARRRSSGAAPEASTRASRAPWASKWSRASVSGSPVASTRGASMTVGGEARLGVQPGADGRAAERQLAHPRQRRTRGARCRARPRPRSRRTPGRG